MYIYATHVCVIYHRTFHMNILLLKTLQVEGKLASRHNTVKSMLCFHCMDDERTSNTRGNRINVYRTSFSKGKRITPHGKN